MVDHLRLEHDLPADLLAADAELRAWHRRQSAALRTSEVLARAVGTIPDAGPPPRPTWDAWWAAMAWSPRRRGALQVALVALLLLALVSTVLFVGAQVRRLPPPFGVAATGQLAFDAEGDIWVAERDGSGLRVLRATSAWESGATWSRDGTRIAFWTSDVAGGPVDPWVMASDGSGARAVVPRLRLAVATEAPAVSWSPSGDRIAFASTVGELYVAAIDGSALVELTGGTIGVASTPAWSPDGRWIAFRGQRYRYGPATLYVVHPDGTGLAAVSERPGGSGSGSHLMADWSTDGVRLTYSDGVGDILVATFEAGAWSERVLVGGPSNDIYPAWAPDGRRIAFVRTDETVTDALWNRGGNEVGRIYLVDAGGGAPERLGPTLVAAAPTHCFSPDGTILRALVAQRGIADPAEIVPSYILIDVATARTVAELAAGDARAIAACSWQRLAE